MPRYSRRRRQSIPLQYHLFFWLLLVPACLLLALRSAYDNPLLLLLLVPPLLALVGYFLWRRWRLQRQMRLAEQRHQQFLLSLRDFTALDAEGFEKAVGSVLTAYGYRNVRGTRRTGDRGVDLYAISPQGERVIVQCKRYSPGHKVSEPDMRNFLGAIVQHQAERGIFVTTSMFTENARELADQHRIKLIDGQQLVTMVDHLKSAAPSRIYGR